MAARRKYDPPEGRVSCALGRLQSWLQHRDSWTVVSVGNLISDLRYWVWRCRGGSWG